MAKDAFGKLQALPRDGKPITSSENPEAALLEVAHGIEAIVEELHLAKKASKKEQRRAREPHAEAKITNS